MILIVRYKKRLFIIFCHFENCLNYLNLSKVIQNRAANHNYQLIKTEMRNEKSSKK